MDSAAEFLEGLTQIDPQLKALGFERNKFEKSGGGLFVQYKKDQIFLQFHFEPPEWIVDMVLYASKGKFSHDDLLEIPEIKKWAVDHPYDQKGSRNITSMLIWCVELLKASMTIIN